MKKRDKDTYFPRESDPYVIRQRLLARTAVTFSGCWEWKGSVTGGKKAKRQYGKIWHDGKEHRCHILSFTTFKGPVPAGCVVCHECDNPPCWNPAHLKAGTMKENMQAGVRRGRPIGRKPVLECIHGHAYTPENTEITASGYRNCRHCRANSGKRARLKRRRAASSSISPT
jgi:HNH endonuclease